MKLALAVAYTLAGAFAVSSAWAWHQQSLWSLELPEDGTILKPFDVPQHRHFHTWARYVSAAEPALDGVTHALAPREPQSQHGREQELWALLQRFQLSGTEELQLLLLLGQREAARHELLTSLNTHLTAARAAEAMRSSARPAVQYSLGILQAQTGNLTAAAQSLRRATQLNASYFPSLYAQASLALVQNDVPTAQRLLNQSLQVAVRAARVDVSALKYLPPATSQHHISLLSAALLEHALAIFQPVQHQSAVATDLQQWHRIVQQFFMLDLGRVHAQLCTRLLAAGAWQASQAHCAQAQAVLPHANWLTIISMFAAPLIFPSMPAVLRHRAVMLREVRTALQHGLRVARPEELRELYHTVYMLPYSGLPSQFLMRDLAHMLQTSGPALMLQGRALHARYPLALGPSSTAQAAQQQLRDIWHRTRARSLRLRFGVVSTQLHDCPTGLLMLQVLRAMQRHNLDAVPDTAADAQYFGAGVATTGVRMRPPSRVRFHTKVIRLHPQGDVVTSWIKEAAHDAVLIPRHITATGNATAVALFIQQLQLDVLLLADSGFEPMVYSLALHRMAPVQALYWGNGGAHTLSVGMPSAIDYYVVGDATAAPAIHSSLMEQVVRIGRVGAFMTVLPPVKPAAHYQAVSTFALMAGRAYVCVTRPLQHWHPWFQRAAIQLLSSLPNATMLAMIDPTQPGWLAQLQRQLYAQDAPAAARIRWIPRQPRKTFHALLASCTAVLDTFPVGMGMDAFEAMQLGTPVVTLPSRQQPVSRSITAALAHAVGAERMVAASTRDFASTVAELVSLDAATMAAVRAELRARAAQVLSWTDARLERYNAMQREGRDLRPHARPNWAEIASSDPARPWLSTRTDAVRTFQQEQLGTVQDWLLFVVRAGWAFASDTKHADAGSSSAHQPRRHG